MFSLKREVLVWNSWWKGKLQCSRSCGHYPGITARPNSTWEEFRGCLTLEDTSHKNVTTYCHVTMSLQIVTTNCHKKSKQTKLYFYLFPLWCTVEMHVKCCLSCSDISCFFLWYRLWLCSDSFVAYRVGKCDNNINTSFVVIFTLPLGERNVMTSQNVEVTDAHGTFPFQFISQNETHHSER